MSQVQLASKIEGRNTILRGRWLATAWVAWIASVALATVVFIAIERFTFVEVWDRQSRVIVLVVSLVHVVGFSTAAAIILWRKYNDWVALLVALVLVSLPLSFIDADEPAFLAANPAWVIPILANSLLIGAGIPLFLLLLVFPNGKPIPRWVGATVLLWVPIVLVTFLPLLSNSTTLDLSLINTAWLGIVTLGVFAQVYRYRRMSTPTERQQTKWVILGLAGFVLGVSIWAIGSFALPPLSGAPGPIDALGRTSFGSLGRPVEIGAAVFMFGLPLAFPFSVVFSILRYRLWDPRDPPPGRDLESFPYSEDNCIALSGARPPRDRGATACLPPWRCKPSAMCQQLVGHKL